MRSKILVAAISLAVLSAGVAIYLLRGHPVPENVIADIDGDPGRGAYVARIAGCIACHTDAASGGALLAGGPPLKTPFGTFRAPNITADRENGIGNWSLQDFARALRHGVSPDGAPYYPAFPYAFYASMTDRDIADLWAAMKTVPPVAVRAEPHDVGFPFNQRWALRGWQKLFVEPGPFVPDPAQNERWNRGKYIVAGPAHCGACHTPRNFLGGRLADQKFHGSAGLPGGEKAPPITAAALRKRRWTGLSLAFGLRYGTLPNGDVLGGSMGEVVWDGMAWLTDNDRRAISAFLLSQPRPAKG